MNTDRLAPAALLALIAASLACASPLQPTESPWEPVPPEVEATWTAGAASPPTEIPATITPPAPSTEEPTAQSLDTLEGFQEALIRAVTDRDAGSMVALMGEEFAIGFWLSEGQTFSASEGASALLGYAKPDAPLACMEQPADLEATLSEYGVSLDRLWGPDVNVAGTVYCTGWGENQDGAALNFVTQNEDGSYRWYGTLLAANGF